MHDPVASNRPRPSLRVRIAAVAALLAAPAVAAAQQVLDVAPAGAPYTQIFQAITAASPGDIVRIQSGTYSGFTINGKSVDVIEAQGATVQVDGAIRVLNLAGDEQVLVRGLSATVDLQASNVHLLQNNLGFVWIEDCELVNDGLGQYTSPHGLTVEECEAVALIRCEITGSTAGPSGDGINADLSNITIHECTVTGGPGSYGLTGTNHGGDGLSMRNSAIFATLSSFTGGVGGNGLFLASPSGPSVCHNGGDGGDGVQMTGTTFDHFLCTFTAGAGGIGASGCTPPAQPGAAGQGINVISGTATHLTSCTSAHSLVSASPVTGGTNGNLQLTGVTGETAYVYVSNLPGYSPQGGLCGVIALGGSPVSNLIGTIPASGTLTATPGTSAGTPGTGSTLYLQPVFFVGSSAVLGTPSTLTIVN